MKASASQLRQALDSASPAVRLYLLHGPDDSGAREWALRLARAMGPEAERTDFDGAALKADPGLLAAEAASLSLFGGARFIRVTGVGEESHDAIAALLEAEQAGNPVIMIGPTLKSTGKVVKLVLAATNAMSFACYPPDAAEGDRLATTIAAEHGMRASPGAAHRLFASCAGDRAVLTREIEKLALYLDAAPERPMPLEENAIDAVGADLGEGEMARAIEAAIDGNAAAVGAELARLAETGVSPIPLLRGLVRRLMVLAELRAAVENGASINDTIERHRVFFREKASTAHALRHWNPVRLSGAINHLRQTERAMMTSASAGGVLAETAFLAVARAARSAQR